MSDKVFRDPLYNYIAFDRQRDEWLIELITSKKSLGFTPLTVNRAIQFRACSTRGSLIPLSSCLSFRLPAETHPPRGCLSSGEGWRSGYAEGADVGALCSRGSLSADSLVRYTFGSGKSGFVSLGPISTV